MPTVVHITIEETRRAWDEYADATRGLEGAEYEHAEKEAWQRLQDILAGVERPPALGRPPLG